MWGPHSTQPGTNRVSGRVPNAVADNANPPASRLTRLSPEPATTFAPKRYRETGANVSPAARFPVRALREWAAPECTQHHPPYIYGFRAASMVTAWQRGGPRQPASPRPVPFISQNTPSRAFCRRRKREATRPRGRRHRPPPPTPASRRRRRRLQRRSREGRRLRRRRVRGRVPNPSV